ncbi:MAG TPA: hypothetical protein VFZ68_06905 [Acidimicrobiales bacterium]
MSEESENRQKRPLDHAVDLLFYAPVGLFFEAPDLVPRLAEQGRVHARNARLFGQFAVRRGQDELRRRLSGVGQQAGDVLRGLGVVPAPEAGPPPAPGTPPPVEVRPEPVVAGPSVDDLAIPDYDSLSASQVVTRLPGLAPAELESVRAYEAAHRGRKTILNKIAQLQA